MTSIAFDLDHKPVSALGGLPVQKWMIVEFWSPDLALEEYATFCDSLPCGIAFLLAYYAFESFCIAKDHDYLHPII